MLTNTYKIINKRLIINILVMIFLLHGIAYYWFPDYINLRSHTLLITYVKYIIILLLYGISFCSIKPIDYLVFIILSVLLIIFHLFALMDVSVNFILLGTYLAPLSIILLYHSLKKNVNLMVCVKITYLITSLCAYIEYFFLQNYFYIYSDLGYRVVSIYVNPNNCAAMIVFLSACLLFLRKKNTIFKLIVVLNTGIILAMTGSRTGGVLFIVLIIISCISSLQGLCLRKYTLIDILKFIFIVIFLSIVLAYYFGFAVNLFENIRQFDKVTVGHGRFSQIKEFFMATGINFIFPCQQNFVYVDNLYLSIWGSFGLFAMIIFVITNIFSLLLCFIKKLKFHAIILFLFLLYAIPENYIYLCPPAYIYWYVINDIYRTKCKIIYCR